MGVQGKKPMVVDNEIKVRNIVNVTVTLDSRYTDAPRAMGIYKKFTSYLEDPSKCIAEDAK